MPDPAEMAQGVNFREAPCGATPEFRVWYSSNPTFTDNAGESPLIASQSIFVQQQKITEALEAVAAARYGYDDVPADHKPLDTKLALSGLTALRKDEQVKTDAPTLRENAIRTKKRLRADEERLEVANHAADDILDEAPPENSEAEARAKAQKEHEESKKGFSGALFRAAHDVYPDLRLDDYIDLFEKLSGRVRGEGEVEVRTGKGFHKSMNGLIDELILDPERLSSLSFACGLLTGVDREAETSGGALVPYLDFLQKEVWDQLDIAQLDLASASSEELEEWFAFIDRAPLSLQRRMDGVDWMTRDEFTQIPVEELKALNASRHFFQFLTNDLLKTVDRLNPNPLVDKMYRLVERGFDSAIDYEGSPEERRDRLAQSPRASRTLDLMGTIFTMKPIAAMVLANGAGSNLSMERRMKMLDMKLFFDSLGLDEVLIAPGNLSTGPIDLNEREARLMGRIYPHKPAPEYSTASTQSLTSDNEALAETIRETAEELARQVDAPDTKANFLIGRNINIDPDEVQNMVIDFRV